MRYEDKLLFKHLFEKKTIDKTNKGSYNKNTNSCSMEVFYIMRSFYRGRTLHRRAAVITALIIGLALVFIVALNTVTVRADVSQNYYFESIQIKADDTLWSIGQNYCPEDMELSEYIDIVRETNGISTDHIVEGNYIMIPVYDN